MKWHRLVALSWLVWGGVHSTESWGTHDPNKKQEEPPVNEQAPENLPSEEEEFYRELVKQPQDAETVEQLINEKDTDTLLQLKETLENQEEEKGSLTEPQAQALARINGALNQRELEKVAGRSGIEGNKKIPIYKTKDGIIRASFENGKPTQNVLTGKLYGTSYKSEKLPSGLVSSDGRIFKDAPTTPPLSRGVSSPTQPSEDTFQNLVDTKSVDGHFVLSATAEQLNNPALRNKLKETGLGWLTEAGNVLRLPANEATKNMMTQSGLEPFASDLIQSRESGQALLQNQLGMYPETTQDTLKNKYFTFKPSDRNYTMKYENTEGQDQTLPGQAHPGFKPVSTLGSGDLWHVITANGVSGLKDLAGSNQSTVAIWDSAGFDRLSEKQSKRLLDLSGSAHYGTSPQELPLAIFDRAVKISVAESPLKPVFSFFSSK